MDAIAQSEPQMPKVGRQQSPPSCSTKINQAKMRVGIQKATVTCTQYGATSIAPSLDMGPKTARGEVVRPPQSDRAPKSEQKQSTKSIADSHSSYEWARSDDHREADYGLPTIPYRRPARSTTNQPTSIHNEERADLGYNDRGRCR